MSLTHLPLIDQVYTVDHGAGLEANVVVVQGASSGEVKLPASLNAKEIIGVTVNNSDDNGKILVRRSGTIEVELGSVVSGTANYVNVALLTDASGEVVPINHANSGVSVGDICNCVGICNTSDGTATAGNKTQVIVAPHVRRREA